MKRLGLTKIFWKIFATFWLVNLAVIFSASYVIVNSLENSRFISMHQQQAENIAQQIIARYEQGENVRAPGMRRFPGGRGPQPGGPRQPLRIFDENNTVVFQHHFGWMDDAPSYQFPLTSVAGKNYQVETRLPKPPLFLKEMLRRLQSTQFVLIFLASTIASALLSYSISRPLKTLGASSREVAKGSLSVSLDAKLLKRGDEVGDLARDFEYMILQVEQSLNSQRQLLHDVSHELRAPLARLQAAAALLEKTPERPDYIEKIHNECARMNALIQQILDYSRLNQEIETREEIDAVACLSNVIDELAFQHPQREVEFKPPQDTATFAGFSDSLERIFANLISNALKFSPSNTPVTVEIKLDSNFLMLTVANTGEHLSQENISHLTEPFFRASHSANQEGFGLGLSIVQRAVAKHKGELQFSAQNTGGLKVLVKLPVLQP